MDQAEDSTRRSIAGRAGASSAGDRGGSIALRCDSVRSWPSPAGGEVELRGSVSSPAPVVHVVVEVEGSARDIAALERSGQDGRAGTWLWTAALPGAVCGADPLVRVVAFDLDGRVETLQIDWKLPVPPVQPWSVEAHRAALKAGRHLLVCHHPSFDGRAIACDVVVVEGWTHSPLGIEACSAQLGDGDPVPGACGLPTAGLVDKLGSWPGLENAGFRVVLDASTTPHGVARLSVATRAGDGGTVSWGARVLVDPDRAYLRRLLGRTRRGYRPAPPGSGTAPQVDVFPLQAPSRSLQTSLARDSYPRSLLVTSENQGLDAGIRAAADGADLTLLVAPGAELRAGALTAFAAAAASDLSAQAFFADHDHRQPDETRCEPWHKPAWSPEHLLAIDYLGPLLALRPATARLLIEAEQPITSLYDAALRLVELDIPVGHVPRVAATLAHGAPPSDPGEAATAIRRLARRRGREVVVEQLDSSRRRVTRPVQAAPLVTIVIPTSGKDELIRRCLHSLKERTTYPRSEVLVVDTSAAGLDLSRIAGSSIVLDKVRIPGPFNFSTACNVGARAASGELLVFLNDDTEVESLDWIERMLDHALTPGVGAVGAKLLYADRTVQHGGVLITLPRDSAQNMLVGIRDESPGPRGTYGVVRNCSAVTGACMMTSRDRFESVAGFDEAFGLEYGDIDLCLRLRAAGQRIVYTPHAVLIHHESMSRGTHARLADRRLLQQRWAAAFRFGDPYYPRALDRYGMFSRA